MVWWQRVKTKNDWTELKNKFGAVKVIRNIDWEDVTFDSRMEAQFYDALLAHKESHNITDIQMQVPYEIQEKFEWEFIYVKKTKLKVQQWNRKYNYEVIKKNKKVQPIKYLADFVIKAWWKEYIIDIKWVETPDFKLKKKMFEKKFNKSLICLTSVVISTWLFFNFLEDDK